MRLVSDVNGISLTRGSRASSSALRRPALAAATTSAPSVGSPLTRQRPVGVVPHELRVGGERRRAQRLEQRGRTARPAAPSRRNSPSGS